MESGQVYSVFYGTNCKGLYYGSNEDSKPADMSGSWLDIDYSKRDRDTRQKERLGYYSVQDAVNAVSLDATKLKITSINLVNGETLSLNWSSNVKDQDLDKVYYEVKLYSSEDKAQLLSINIPGRNLKRVRSRLRLRPRTMRRRIIPSPWNTTVPTSGQHLCWTV